MRSSDPLSRWLARSAAVVLAGAMAVTGISRPASAHGQLAMSNPAAGSTVGTALESLALYFTEKPATNAFFTVIAPSGERVDRAWSHGEPKRLDKPVQELFLVDGKWEPRLYPAGFPSVIPVAHWPAKGVYTVRYVSKASDGERVRGDLTFTYTGPVTAAPAGWNPPTGEPDQSLMTENAAGASTPPAEGFTPGASAPAAAAPVTPESGGVAVWLVPALLVLGAGALIWRVARRR